MITLRPVKEEDIHLFAKWWRDPELLRRTSGYVGVISDTEVEQYFTLLLSDTGRVDRIIMRDQDPIGHVNLVAHPDEWWETQIVIGEQVEWGKGYGADAVRQMLNVGLARGITKVFLEVRPENAAAIRAYEKCGFVHVRVEERPENIVQPKVIRMELVQARYT